MSALLWKRTQIGWNRSGHQLILRHRLDDRALSLFETALADWLAQNGWQDAEVGGVTPMVVEGGTGKPGRLVIRCQSLLSRDAATLRDGLDALADAAEREGARVNAEEAKAAQAFIRVLQTRG